MRVVFHAIGQPVATPDLAGWLGALQWLEVVSFEHCWWWCYSEWLPSSCLSGSLGQESTQSFSETSTMSNASTACNSALIVAQWWEHYLFEKATVILLNPVQILLLNVLVANDFTLHPIYKVVGLLCHAANSLCPPSPLFPVLEKGRVSSRPAGVSVSRQLLTAQLNLRSLKSDSEGSL